MNFKIIFGLIVLFTLLTTVSLLEQNVFAESINKMIFSDFKEYEIAEIIEERSYRLSPITKIQGFTTTGDMFFIFTNKFSDFEKVMLLDREGQWQKAELREKTVEKGFPGILKNSIDLNIVLDQYQRVYNKSEYKLFIKTFDNSIYSGKDFQNFSGVVSGAKVSAIIIDPNGEIKHDFEGFVEHGIFEGSVLVPENLWQRGWYTVDLVVEFEGKFYQEQLSFYVYGTVQSNSSSSCPTGQTKNQFGVCV